MQLSIARCTADGWSAAVIACMAAVNTNEDSSKCKLTPDQTTKLETDMKAVVVAAVSGPKKDVCGW